MRSGPVCCCCQEQASASPVLTFSPFVPAWPQGPWAIMASLVPYAGGHCAQPVSTHTMRSCK